MVESPQVTADGFREQLIHRGICQADHPAIEFELYGSLRIRTGFAQIPLRADSIRTAVLALLRLQPAIERLLPPVDHLADSHRFSINGSAVTTDLDTPLREGDHLILFSASVGG
jgi:hypothetical protein